jgi:hypothetical protein
MPGQTAKASFGGEEMFGGADGEWGLENVSSFLDFFSAYFPSDG